MSKAPLNPPLIKPLNARPTMLPNLTSVPRRFINKPRNIVPAGITSPVITVAIPRNFLAPSGRLLNPSAIPAKKFIMGVAILTNSSPMGAIASLSLSIAAVSLVPTESSMALSSFSAEAAISPEDIAATSRTLDA